MSAATEPMTVDALRAQIIAYLSEAAGAVASIQAVPTDAVDAEDFVPLWDALNALDEFVLSFGAAQRDQEHQERQRERRVAAHRAHPDLEKTVMHIDRRVQRIVSLLGTRSPSAIAEYLFPGTVMLLLSGVVELLDACPAGAFREPTEAELAFGPDATVLGLMAVLRQRASGAPTAPAGDDDQWIGDILLTGGPTV